MSPNGSISNYYDFCISILKNRIKKKQVSLLASFMAPQVGLEPTTLRLTAECSTTELLRIIKSGDYLPSQAVAHQVLSACKSLTSVFDMGTGGSS